MHAAYETAQARVSVLLRLFRDFSHAASIWCQRTFPTARVAARGANPL